MIYKFKDMIKKKEVAHLYLYTVKLPSRYLGVIENVWTDDEYRRQGRATKLIEKAFTKGKKLSLDVIELTVRDDQPHIREFYEKMGFYDRHNTSMRYAVSSNWKQWKEIV